MHGFGCGVRHVISPVRRERHRRRCIVIERLHTESVGSNCDVEHDLDECASKRSLRLCLRLRLSVSEQKD